MRGSELYAWIASLPAEGRDAAVEEQLGIGGDAPSSAPPGEHLVGYHASGVDAIVRAIADAPITERDVLVDLGSGLGKVVLLAHLLTGSKARGIELQPSLAHRARAAAARLGADVRFDVGDVREADLDDGTVFFLYAPFTGPVLADVCARLREVARRRPIAVCALGIDVDRVGPWLVARRTDSFWLTIYDVEPS